MVLPDRGNLADPEAKGRGLDQDLGVEDEVIAVLEKRDRLEEASLIGAIAGMELLKVQPQNAVLG